MQFIFFPGELSLLLSLDPHLLNLVKLLPLLWHVDLTFLLEFSLLNRDLIARSDLSVIQHVDCHIHALDHLIANPCITLGLTGLISVELQLFLACLRINTKYTTSGKVLSQFLLRDIIR